MEKMSKYKTPYEYNSQIAASVTKNSSPVDICRAFIFYQFEFKNRNLDIVLGPKEQVRMVTDYVMVEDGIDLDKLEKSLDELATVTPWKAPWESLEGKSMNDFQSVMAGAADSGLSPWGESWSDHDVVVEFLNEKRNGKCYDFNSLCKYFVTQAYKINKSSIPDVTPYIREQLDKIAKYKTVSAKMCLLRDILYQIDVYIVQNGRFYPTNENIYIDEIKTVYDQMPADSIATLEIKFRTIEQLDAVIARRVKTCEYDQQRVLSILPQGARRLLRAIARERKVKEPQAGSFIAKHGLRAASSVKTSLDMLVEKELVYPSPDGYVIYDRLMAEYLRSRG